MTTNKVKWNVTAGTYVRGRGFQFNRDYRSEAMAKRIAAEVARDHPDWGTPTIRKSELRLDFLPGFACWMEQKQYPWPAAS